RHAGPALLRPGVRGEGRPRVPHPPARLRARPAGDHRERHPGRRHRYTGPAEDPATRPDHRRSAAPQSERTHDDARRRRARHRRALPPGHVLDHGQRDRRRRRGRYRRVTYTQGVVLGLVQGLTEFLPVSSSGHLILVPHVFGWPDQGLAFDAVMHLGTLVALLAYFRAELTAFVAGALPRRLVLILVVATIPGALAGVVFGRWIEAHVRSPLAIAVFTAFWAIVMWMADRRASSTPAGAPAARDPLETVSWSQGVAVGAAPPPAPPPRPAPPASTPPRRPHAPP